MVHGRPAPVNKVAAQVAAGAHEKKGRPARPLPGGAASATAQHHRKEVEAQRRRVDHSVHGADAAVPAVQVLPIGQARGDGHGGAGRPRLQREVSGPRRAAVPPPTRRGQEVQPESQRPRPDRDCHGNRMHGVAVRTAVQRVRELLARPAHDLPGPGNGLADLVAGPVQAFRRLDPADNRVDDLAHAPASPSLTARWGGPAALRPLEDGLGWRAAAAWPASSAGPHAGRPGDPAPLARQRRRARLRRRSVCPQLLPGRA